MKKIIISLLIIGSLTTGSVFAYNKNIELNTEEYINLINSSISELNAEIEPKEKANIGTIFLNGIDEGYIIPSINNDTKLKNGITELVNNIKDGIYFGETDCGKTVAIKNYSGEMLKFINCKILEVNNNQVFGEQTND